MQNRYDFVYLFDVKDGNPNGDPDAGNLPRVDAETGHGLVTDVCLKRKIRNYVELGLGADSEGYKIYVREKAILIQKHAEAYKALKFADPGKAGKRKGTADQVRQARDWMCANYFDVRSFGAVMSLGINCGQVRGPVQITFARSVEPVLASEHAITRMAVATEAEAEKQQGDNRTMGRKFTIPYGLYRTHGFISAPLAEQTGFSEKDLDLFWKSLEQMFEHDRSAARGEMSPRSLLVFRHDDRLGNASAHALFDRVTVNRTAGDRPARDFRDYAVAFDDQPIDEVIPVGGERELENRVTMIRRI